MSAIRSITTGAAMIAALILFGWLYGQHKYDQGVNDTEISARLAAFDQYQSDVERMAAASWELQNTITELQYAKPKIITQYKEVVAQAPLPVDCRIDDKRLRGIQSAVRAATAAR